MEYDLHTLRLSTRTATAHDAAEVLSVYASNADLLRLLDHDHDPALLTERFLQMDNLPPQGDPACLNNHVLLSPSSGTVVGLISFYVGYPKPQIAYIGELYLHRGAQGNGLGREVYRHLETRLRADAIHAVRVGVGLRNWNALRFWIKLGFQYITGMSGSRTFSDTSYAHLELHKNL